MENQLQVFANDDLNASIRVIEIEGEPWFVAADVCKCLDINTEQIRRLDDDEKGLRSIHTPGGSQNMSIISEPGLYNLIMGSRKPEAKQFKRWVTHEVLPAIRKTGHYGKSTALVVTEQFKSGDSKAAVDWLNTMSDILKEAGKLLAEEKEKSHGLEEKLQQAQPKLNYVDVVLNHPGLITTTIIAKDYGYTTVKFNKLLHKLHIVFKQSGIWQLYDEYAKRGWGKNKTTYQDNTGCVVIHNYWTQIGRMGLYELLKTKGILPLIEQEQIDYAIDMENDDCI